jgi:hypothetical protein
MSAETVARALTEPTVQEGLSHVREGIRAALQGRPASIVAEGVDNTGFCVSVVEISDESGVESDAQPDYAVFTYDLQRVTEPGFRSTPVRSIVLSQDKGYDQRSVWIGTEISPVDDPMPASPEVAQVLFDKRAEHPFIVAAPWSDSEHNQLVAVNGWCSRNTLEMQLPKRMAVPSDADLKAGTGVSLTLPDKKLKSFEAAAINLAKQARIDQEVTPLTSAAAWLAQQGTRCAVSLSGVADFQRRSAIEDLEHRARVVAGIMRANPAMIDKAEMVFDPARAWDMAHAAQRDTSQEVGKLGKRGMERARKDELTASAAYGVDPINRTRYDELPPIRDDKYTKRLQKPVSKQ